MTCSVLRIKCEECNMDIPAYKEGIVDILTDYAIICPECKNKTFFHGKPASLEAGVPEGAIPIVRIEKELAI